MHYEPVAGTSACGTAASSRGATTGSAISAPASSPRSPRPWTASEGARARPRRCRREAFPLPRLGPVLREILGELLEGRGFILLRGLPVERMTREEQAIAYLGIGSWLGSFRSQNAKGHLLGHVKDLGLDIRDPNVRYYQTNRKLEYHTDSVDIVGPAVPEDREGGRRELPRQLDDRLQRGARAPARAHAGALRAVRHRPARRGARRHAAVVRHPDLQPARGPPLVHLRAPVHRVGAEELPRSAAAYARAARGDGSGRRALQRSLHPPFDGVPPRRHPAPAQPPDPALAGRLRELARARAPSPSAAHVARAARKHGRCPKYSPRAMAASSPERAAASC